MQNHPDVITTSMHRRTMSSWYVKRKKKIPFRRIIPYTAAAIVCFAIGGAVVFGNSPAVDVMSHIDTGFDYDETIGRLQYVSNILPESAMVFLGSDGIEEGFLSPVNADIAHTWSQDEPWIEYLGCTDVYSCQSGEVMNIVKNRADEYSVRILHSDGYESLYSGLTQVAIVESERIEAGQAIGVSGENTAFELRKDGMSVLPVFSIL